MEMHIDSKNVLLISMPFAGTAIPSIQLPILEGYLKERDIDIQTRHLYIKAAEFYGLSNYNFLIYPPLGSYDAQMFFSKYVFPQYWENNIDKFRNYFNEIVNKNNDIQNNPTFDYYVNQTDQFFNWAIEHVDWKSFDIIGFTLNYGQFLPSLSVAKKIKEHWPEIKIIFGGSRTVEKLGIKVLESFDFVDFICSGDGEETLYRLASDYHNYKSIPNLIYRDDEKVRLNRSEDAVDLNSLPIPSYDKFYGELSLTSDEVKQYFQYHGRLPVEISRGCWWNKCTFCNRKIQQMGYRLKNIDKIVDEIKFLSEKYKILSFQIIGETLPKSEYKPLLEKIKDLGKDLTFFAETRAGQLEGDDYRLLKESGFTNIQTGIETFSQNYIKKMDKGVRVIDNIAVLKFCRENGIVNRYNIIADYPNEEKIDFEETKKNIQFFKQYLDPPNLTFLRLDYGSPISENPEKFNIKKLEYTDIDKIMFPKEFLEKNFNCVFDFERYESFGENDWKNFVEDWEKENEQFAVRCIETKEDIDKYVFYFLDGGDFLKIYDKRDGVNVKIYVLNKLEREVILACCNVISFGRLREFFRETPENELVNILKIFEEKGIVFREDDRYLSLPLNYSILTGKTTKKDSEHLLYSSGMQRSL